VDLLDLRKLSIFVRVVENGSFTRAAAQLVVAQSALSRKVRELEDELGVQLLHRDGHGVLPTDAGLQLFTRAKALLEESQTLLNDIKEMGGSVPGSVVLGMPPSVSQALLTPLLTSIRATHPDIQVKVVEGFSGHVQEWLLNRRIDVGVLYASRKLPTLIGDELVTEDMFIVGPPTSPFAGRGEVTLAEVCATPLVVPSRPHGLRILIDDACIKAKVTPTIGIEILGLSTVKDLISKGFGHAILPSSAVLNEVESGELIATRIIEPIISRKLLLATANQRSASRATREVAQLIRLQVGELVRHHRWGFEARMEQPAEDYARSEVG
jgi:LysR family nitrogen assimilation transcriptional regulator